MQTFENIKTQNNLIPSVGLHYRKKVTVTKENGWKTSQNYNCYSATFDRAIIVKFC